ncbi:NUDIX hydrolase [Leucobacter soli]|uniref:Nudix hydrolase NudL n=1 Tax=Leucobacter soli TaxID=2812850 RepID=A0A916JX29_9MICO|nr:CoA pyrophosphatase [Leucobacter soli]CAG7607291.1 putative Nudix hydrolase NudL [Leucobacter soli]
MTAAGGTAEARAQLASALERGVGIDFIPQGDPGDLALRRSAVLILFGELDAVPARTGDGLAAPRELDVLLTRRSDTMRHHPGQIAFPGGGVEAEDRDSSATALREASEETGLDPRGVEILGELTQLHIPVSSNLVTPVVGWWRLPSEIAADHSESVEVMRVPVAELLDPAARGTSVLRRGPVTHRGAAFRLSPRFGEHLVWGFTGMLLSSLFDGLGWAEPWDRSRLFEV